jgi:hypothetical protein
MLQLAFLLEFVLKELQVTLTARHMLPINPAVIASVRSFCIIASHKTYDLADPLI